MIYRFFMAFVFSTLAINSFGQQIPVDTLFLTGKLDNGLTYYIRKSSNPPKTADFYIVHNVGSLQEDDNQRGLAHFLEHMAFNGTKNFPGKNLLNSLAHNGVKFGTNVNAYTSMDRTVYNISSVPIVRDSFIDSVILMLHDWSSFISCEPNEVNNERGVILEEWRRGDESRTRMMSAIFEYEQHGSRFAKRKVIGLPEIIENFSNETLVNYYHKWYRPDLQAIVIVGDINPKEIELKIRKIFSDITKPTNAAKREIYPMPANGELYIGKHKDQELKSTSVRIIARYPLLDSAVKQTKESIKFNLVGNLITDMMSVRGSAKKAANISGYKTIIPNIGDSYYAWRNFRLTAIPKTGKVEQALCGILTDYEQMRRYGFSNDEINDAKALLLATIEKNSRKMREPKNEDYVDIAVNSFTRSEPLYNIKKYFTTQKEILNAITVDDINDYINKYLNYNNMVVIFSGPDSAPDTYPTDDRIRFIFDSVSIAPIGNYNYVSKNKLNFSFKLSDVDISTPKQVVFDNVKDIVNGIDEIDLKGGIKVYVINNKRSNAFIKMNAYRAGGYSIEPDSLIKAMRIFKSLYINFTVADMNRSDFARYLNNKQISIRTEINNKLDIWSGSFTDNSIEDFFKTFYIYASSGYIDKKGFKSARDQFIKSLKNEKSQRNRYLDSCTIINYGYNVLSEPFNLNDTIYFTESFMNRMFKKHFCDFGEYVFVFEGTGLTSDKLIPYISKYISNLPIDNSVKHKNLSETNLNIKEKIWKKGKKELRYLAKDISGTKASVLIELFSKIRYNAVNVNSSKFLMNVLRDRYTKTIREERGGSYHVGVINDFYQTPIEYLLCCIEFDTNSSMVDELIECVWDEIKDIAKNGPSEGEISNIKQYYYKLSAQREKQFISAIPIVANCLIGEKYVDILALNNIDNVTVKSVQKVAKELLKQKNHSTFIFEPEL